MRRLTAATFSNMRAISALMLTFGLTVGLIFPLVVDPFVIWKPEQKLSFRLASAIAGLGVGLSCFLIMRATLYRQKVELERAKDRFGALTESTIRKGQWVPELSHPEIPTCWRELGCGKLDCPVYGHESMRCWLIAGTFCSGEIRGQFASKQQSCTRCDIYRESIMHSPLVEIGENFNSLMTVVHEREHELAETNRMLQQMAITDTLTGLKNHGYFQERLGIELSRARRYERFLSLIMVDLDHFKSVNDRFGHQTGDQVLKCIGQLMIQHTRDIDMVARYGGEEFMIILPDTAGADALGLAEKLRNRIGDAMPSAATLPRSYLSASLGVADYPLCASDKDGLIKASDSAMLHSKKCGRNRVTYYLALNDCERSASADSRGLTAPPASLP